MITNTNIITIGNYEKAEKLFRKLLNRLEENRPFTLGVMDSLASTYVNQGKDRDAEVLYKQCLDKMKVVLGESHPHTLATMGNLERITITTSELLI